MSDRTLPAARVPVAWSLHCPFNATAPCQICKKTRNSVKTRFRADTKSTNGKRKMTNTNHFTYRSSDRRAVRDVLRPDITTLKHSVNKKENINALSEANNVGNI